MPTTLTDRASLLRAFFRLVNSSSSDDALTEHDASGETLEGAYVLLNHGLWDAQDWVIEAGEGDRWVTSQSLPTEGSWQGSESTEGGSRWTALPSDFLRLVGDREVSGLRTPDGKPWGALVPFHHRHRVRGNRYWFQNGKLHIARGASPPSDFEMDYHHRLAELADGTTVDFPEDDRPLIPAYAAYRGIMESWPVLDGADKSEIRENLEFQKQQSRRRRRHTRQPRQMRMRATLGTHYFYP